MFDVIFVTYQSIMTVSTRKVYSGSGKAVSKSGEWSQLAANLGRSRQQVHQRWIDQLDPNIKKGKWSPDDDSQLIEAQARL